MITVKPIGTFHADSKYPYEATRQATGDSSLGEIHLRAGKNFEQALEDLEGFERIWIVYQFHHNRDWKPKVTPPRGPRTKRGVFATRAPYRPNAIGLSCVRLVKVDGLHMVVEGHDLLDGTPILDIKPYLPYADAFPESRVGWLEHIESSRWQIEFSPAAEKQLQWLETQGLTRLRSFIQGQLEFEPLDHHRKRVEKLGSGYRLAYRTWRVDFAAELSSQQIHVRSVSSGYTAADLKTDKDPYIDKVLHNRFSELFQTCAV